ncbi:hypothetical protein L1887_41917 [Cichorium endivia]|nr:hypothetical protein L1887_41917 [Cichorium endivia]
MDPHLDPTTALVNPDTDKNASPMEVEEPVSVHDAKAFAEKHLADLGQEEADFAVCTWKIKGWRTLDKRITGPEFECGGHRWRILLFPFGNSNGQPNDMVSVYLDYADPKGSPEGWHLNVKGMDNLADSFRDYVQTEMLEGDNKYHAEGYGLQDAKKGVIFEKFPPVLHLQLKRFEYDIEKDSMVKINDRHEFPLDIDLADYIDKESPVSNEDWKYRLHGVLVHSGDLHGGHYFALLKPEKDSNWFKFDDDRVTPVTEKEVLEDNYGGEIPNGHPAGQIGARAPVRAMKRFTNAYMLVYVRERDIDEVLKPMAPEDTPVHLRQRLEDERLQMEARKREREEQHLYLTVKLITEDTFRGHQGFDLATFEERNLPATDLPTFRVLKNELYLNFKSRIAAQYNLPEDLIRMWVLVNRQNKTVRPDTVVPENDPNLTLETVRDRMASRQHDLRLFLEVKLFEEIKPGMIEQMKPKATFAQSEIQDGDVICFQIELSEKDAHDYESQSLYSNPIQFYDFLQNQIKVLFKPRFEDVEYKAEFELTLSKKMTYDMMAAKAGERLKHDPFKLRFTTGNGPNGTPKTVLKRTANQTQGAGAHARRAVPVCRQAQRAVPRDEAASAGASRGAGEGVCKVPLRARAVVDVQAADVPRGRRPAVRAQVPARRCARPRPPRPFRSRRPLRQQCRPGQGHPHPQLSTSSCSSVSTSLFPDRSNHVCHILVPFSQSASQSAQTVQTSAFCVLCHVVSMVCRSFVNVVMEGQGTNRKRVGKMCSSADLATPTWWGERRTYAYEKTIDGIRTTLYALPPRKSAAGRGGRRSSCLPYATGRTLCQSSDRADNA